MTYGCHNHPPRADFYPMRAGFFEDERERNVEIRNNASKDCRYTLNSSDVKCSGCKHAQQPESVL